MQITRTVFRDDHEMLRTTARRFLERECCRAKVAEWDKAGRVDRETWLKAGREGLLCAHPARPNTAAAAATSAMRPCSTRKSTRRA